MGHDLYGKPLLTCRKNVSTIFSVAGFKSLSEIVCVKLTVTQQH